MHRFAVGELFEPTTRSYPDDTARYTPGSLLLCVASPTVDEMDAVRHAPIRLGVADVLGCVLVLYAVGRMTGEAPFQWHLLPEPRRVVPDPPTATQRFLTTVFLVDATCGVIRAMRQVTMSPRVTQTLIAAIRRQATRPSFDPVAYQARLDQVYARWQFADLARIGRLEHAGQADAAEVLMGSWDAGV